MNFIKRLFLSKKKLLEELEKTKVELSDCNNEVLKKQEHINTTNAYWKKKMYATKAAVKEVKKSKEQ
jgi:hypothetical protein